MKDPCKRLHLRVVTDTGVENRIIGTRAFGDVAFTRGIGRKGGWTTIRRASSDDQGQVSVATGGLTISDDHPSGWMRDLIKQDTERFFRDTEAGIEVISEALRKSTDGADWRYILRGKISDKTFRTDRQERMRRRGIELRVVDALEPYLDRKIPNVPFMRSDFPNIHREIEGTMIPLIGGEHSKPNALDLFGNPVPPGMAPAIHVGKIMTLDDVPVMGSPVDVEPAYLTPPTISYLINGTPGTRTVYIGVTKLSPVGETVLGNILQIEDAPDYIDATNNIEITGFADAQAVGYHVYLGENPTPSGRVATLAAGTTVYIYAGASSPSPPGPPAINTAQVPPDGLPGAFFWDFYIVALGRNLRIKKIYASDVQGSPPRRVTEDAWMTGGVDFYTHDTPSWPFPNPWITLPSGIDVIGYMARGPRSDHHINGIVTMAVDTCGYLGENDEPIKQAGPMFSLFINEFVLKNNGEGYRSGDWGPLEAYSDGVTKLNTSLIEDWQDLTKLFLDDDDGYLTHIYLRQPITVRTFLQLFYAATGAKWATDHNGRGYVWDYDPFTAATAGRLYRERIEALRAEPLKLDRGNVEPVIRFQYAYNPDTDKMESEIEEARHPDVLDEVLRESRELGVLQCRFSRHAATVRDAQRRKARRLGKPRWKQGIVTKLQPGLEELIGNRFRITHDDAGWTDHPFTLVEIEIDLNRDEVLLVGYDTEPVLIGEGEMAPGAEMPFVMQ